MRIFTVKNLVALGILTLGFGVQAQAKPQRYVVAGDDPKMLFSDVRSDLERAQQDAFPRDTDSIERARAELNALDDQWSKNGATSRQADVVISALERVLSDNHLSLRDRGRLSDDLSKVRRFRDEHR